MKPASIDAMRCVAFTAGLIAQTMGAHATTAPDAESEASRLLSAIGGRANWAALKNTVNDSQQFRVADPVEVRAVITMDFERLRFRIDTTAPGLNLARVIDGDSDWRLTRDGRIDVVPPAIRADDLRWHAGHVYRTIHRVARRDASVTLGLGADGRLEVFDSGKRIAWFKLNAIGEPYAFGAHDDQTGTLSGPWKFERDGIRHPVWVSSPDGTWRASVNALRTNVTLDPAIFAKPAGVK